MQVKITPASNSVAYIVLHSWDERRDDVRAVKDYGIIVNKRY